MTLASHAFAPEFAHTAAVGPAADYDLLPADTLGVPTPCNVASGTYRMCLAPAASDFLRASQAAINAAMLAEGSTNTVTFTLSAAGVLTITFAAALSSNVAFASGVWQRLGLASNSIALDGNNTITGTRPVWYLALLSAATGPYWQPLQAGGAEQTTGGRVYAIASTLTSWQRSLKVHFQPTTPTLRAAHNCDATAMYPAEEYMDALGSTATAREWSVLDVLYSARNALCGYTSTWGTARVTVGERIWRVYVGPEALLSTRTELLKAEWLAFCEWEVGLVAPAATPTETRA